MSSRAIPSAGRPAETNKHPQTNYMCYSNYRECGGREYKRRKYKSQFHSEICYIRLQLLVKRDKQLFPHTPPSARAKGPTRSRRRGQRRTCPRTGTPRPDPEHELQRRERLFLRLLSRTCPSARRMMRRDCAHHRNRRYYVIVAVPSARVRRRARAGARSWLLGHMGNGLPSQWLAFSCGGSSGGRQRVP